MEIKCSGRSGKGVKMYANQNDWWDYLAHHGIKGQKHGVRNAEWYPIADYEAYLSRRDKKKLIKTAKKEAKNERKAEKKELKAQKKADKFNKKVEAATNRGDKDFLDKNFSKMSDEQIGRIVERMKIKNYADNVEAQKAMEAMDRFSKATSNIKNIAENAAGTYNIAAKVHNALFPEDKKWAIAGEKVESPNRIESIERIFSKEGDDKAKYTKRTKYEKGTKIIEEFGSRPKDNQKETSYESLMKMIRNASDQEKEDLIEELNKRK